VHVIYRVVWMVAMHSDRLPQLAEDLVTRRIAVLVATGGAHLAARAATSTIPIVFTTTGEPVKVS
jgi:putative tryptophan/tyrosine transport system substrate-binding protein